jgi:hypothetical protein
MKLTDRRNLEFGWLGGAASSKLLNRRKSVDPAKIRDFGDSAKTRDFRDPDNHFGSDVTTFTTSSAAPNLVNRINMNFE